MKRILQVFSLMVGVGIASFSVAAGAQDGGGASAFTGSWFVNPARLEVSGPTFSFTPDAEGFSIRYSDGMGPKQACNGQPQQVRPGYTRVCTKEADGYAVTTTHDNKTVSEIHWTASPDGKTLHERRAYTNPDDSSDTREVTAVRVGTGSGIAGEWKVTGYRDTAFSKPFVLTGDATSLSVQRPGASKPDVFKLDGSEIALSNTVKSSMRLDSPHVLHERVLRDGKVVSDRVLKLAADGNSITEVETHPDNPADRTVTVYERR